MHRLLIAVLLLAATACGSSRMNLLGSAPIAPQSPELAVLARLVGEWEAHAEFVSPTAEEMTALMREQDPTFEGYPTNMRGGARNRWVLNGHFLRHDGWHEDANGNTVNTTEYFAWDAAEKRYRINFYGGNGDRGEGWMTWDPATRTFHMTSEGLMQGQPTRGEGTMTFTDPDTMEWTWTAHGPLGEMKMKGINRRT